MGNIKGYRLNTDSYGNYSLQVACTYARWDTITAYTEQEAAMLVKLIRQSKSEDKNKQLREDLRKSEERLFEKYCAIDVLMRDVETAKRDYHFYQAEHDEIKQELNNG